ncbi:MAG: phosphocholine cytidylyltransferase family protein [Verrucomicrobiota bacterium]
MKIIFLAAGQGTRLRPLTDSRPKGLVEYQGKPIIRHGIDAATQLGITDISIITGYKAEVFPRIFSDHTINYFHNDDFMMTNMVYSLFCAEEAFDDDLIVSYGDIVYTSDVLKYLIRSGSPISTVVDLDWQKLWNSRMANPLDDAESLILTNDDYIKELGKKPNSYNDIMAQYIGLTYIKKSFLDEVSAFYRSLNPAATYDGKSFRQMYMTSFLQAVIDELMPIKAVKINRGWTEIDSVEDLSTRLD